MLEREIGLSRGAIFSYFPSKLDLFVALAQEDQRRLIELWLERGWEGVVRHIVEDDPEWIGVYLDASRMLRTDPELRERWRTLNPEGQAALEAHYRGLQETGEIRDDVPLDTLGRFLGIVFDGIAVQQAARFGSRSTSTGRSSSCGRRSRRSRIGRPCGPFSSSAQAATSAARSSGRRSWACASPRSTGIPTRRGSRKRTSRRSSTSPTSRRC